MYTYISIYTYLGIYLFLYSVICCSLDLISRLRAGCIVNTATDTVLENSTAQSNLSVSVHYIIKRLEEDHGLLILHLVI